MSVTILIANSKKYIDQNHPEMIKVETYDCQCAYGGTPEDDCWECKGSGIVKFENYPYEMNLANGNFRTLWNSLGFSTEEGLYGVMRPQAILKALKRTPYELIERESKQEGNVHTGGIHTGQAMRYLEVLEVIAREAEKREEVIIWG